MHFELCTLNMSPTRILRRVLKTFVRRRSHLKLVVFDAAVPSFAEESQRISILSICGVRVQIRIATRHTAMTVVLYSGLSVPTCVVCHMVCSNDGRACESTSCCLILCMWKDQSEQVVALVVGGTTTTYLTGAGRSDHFGLAVIHDDHVTMPQAKISRRSPVLVSTITCKRALPFRSVCDHSRARTTHHITTSRAAKTFIYSTHDSKRSDWNHVMRLQLAATVQASSATSSTATS
jgi:hypothetical protein